MKFKFAVLFSLLSSTAMPAWSMEPFSSEEENTQLSEKRKEPSLNNEEPDPNSSSAKRFRPSPEEQKGDLHVLCKALLLKVFKFLDFRGMVSFGELNTFFLHLSKGAHGYRQLCIEAGINTTSPRDCFLREYPTNPLLFLAVNEYRRAEFSLNEEKERTEIAINSMLPQVNDPKIAARLLIRMHEFGIKVLDDSIGDGIYDRLLKVSDSEESSSSDTAEANFYRAQMRFTAYDIPLTYEDAYDLLVSSRLDLSPENQAYSDFFRARMRVLEQVPNETLSNGDAYALLVSSRPHLAGYNRVCSDFYRVQMRVQGHVSNETLSNGDTYTLLTSLQPRLLPYDLPLAEKIDTLIKRIEPFFRNTRNFEISLVPMGLCQDGGRTDNTDKISRY